MWIFNKESPSSWETFDINIFFERGGARGPSGCKGKRNDRVVSWRTNSGNGVKSDHHLSRHRKKTSFLERFKKRSSKRRAENGSTASATMSTVSPAKEGWLHSPTVTEELTLEKSMMSEDPQPTTLERLQIDDGPIQYPVPASCKRTYQHQGLPKDGESNQHEPHQDGENRGERKKSESNKFDILDESNLEDYECFLIPPKRSSSKRTNDPNEMQQRETCLQMAMEDIRANVTTSMNSAMNLWSRMQNVFFHESNPMGFEELVKGMAWHSQAPHPTTVFVTPRPMEENLIVESLADSLTTPTFDADDDVSSLTYPAFVSTSKLVPPVNRARKSNELSTTWKSKKCLRGVPVKEIFVKMYQCWEDERCIQMHDKEPYDEKDELFDEIIMDKDHCDANKFETFETKFESGFPGSGFFTSNTSNVSNTERFPVNAESRQPRWNASIQHSVSEPNDANVQSFIAAKSPLALSMSNARVRNETLSVWSPKLENRIKSIHLHDVNEADLGSVSC